jgi:hypothetical protein
VSVVLCACADLGYDQVFSPVEATPGVEPVLIADRKPRFLGGWRWRPYPPETAALGPALANRWCKFFPELIFPEAEISIYVDANTLILADLTPLVAEFRASGAAIGLFRHGERGDIVAELAFGKAVGKIPPTEAATAEAQVAGYLAAGLPAAHLLTENGVIFRRHGAPGLDAAMALWWQELGRASKRDQLSLPWVLHATGLAAKVWDWSYVAGNRYFERYPHRRSLLEDANVFMKTKLRFGAGWRLLFGPPLFAYHGLIKRRPR